MNPKDVMIGAASAVAALLLVLLGLGGHIETETPGPAATPTAVAEAPVVACPPGWAAYTARDKDVRVDSCTKGQWIVWLRNDGSFDHAWDGSGPFVEDPKAVPEWP